VRPQKPQRQGASRGDGGHDPQLINPEVLIPFQDGSDNRVLAEF
jgi:hypothetical protein